jgi:hypothetical protein
MSDTPLTLPPRPSLEQLRKQAKERLDQMPGGKLTDAQFALARDYGFESWPKLARHVEALASPEVEQQDRIARDMVAAYRDRDEAAAVRLNDLFHSRITIDQIRDFIRGRLSPLPGGSERLERFGIADARQLVAGLYGFADWDAFVTQAAGAARAATAPGLSATPPFYKIDEERGLISPQQPMSARDWETLVAVMRERGLTGLEANNQMDDEAMARLAELPHLTVLKLHGSDRLTDRGLRHLAALADLEDVELGGWKSPMTDAGFAALRGLPRLRRVGSWWSRRLTDAGVGATLSSCPSLEDASFGGTSIGDGLIEALAAKPGVRRVFCGDGVTDAGLSRVQDIPRFRHWQGGDRTYGLMEFDAGPTYLAIKGPFTSAGLRALAGLDGLFALNVHWLANGMTSADLARLAPLANLGFLAIDGDLCDDEAMRQIGRLPELRMLLAQQPAAGDEGFQALSASPTLEYLWGRECPHLTGRGFTAMASMPSLKGLAVSLKGVDDAALATLPRFPSLRSLMPMDVTDEGFRHVGRCERLEALWCMYCRETGDAATEHLTGLRLKTYYAGLTKITDRSLTILSRMTSLERVQLHECHGVTDAGVRALADLPVLHELAIEGCRNVTRQGSAGFAPRVRVSYSTV